jgi:hemolysin activation/secretion protein
MLKIKIPIWVLAGIGAVMICGHAVADSVLPKIEENKNRLSSAGKVFVREFRLEGNTVFSDEVLSAILAPYQNREITAEELHEAKNGITQYYVINGYRNSGALVPDQEIKDGIILMNIIEGKLSEIEVSGNTWLRSGYVRRRLELATEDGKKPFNINTMQQYLRLVEQDPRVDNISAYFGPGLEPGQGILKVDIKEARPYHLTLRFNNYNSPGIGAYRGEAELQHLNLTGWGDALTLRYGLTEGLDDYMLNYTVPLTRRDTSLFFKAERSKALVVAAPFSDLDIKSDTETYSAGIRHPFYKTLARELAAGLKYEDRHSETSLLDEDFSFPDSGADEEGETDFNVIRFSQEWVDRSVSQVIAAFSSLNMGSVDEGELEGDFFTWLIQFQWLRRIEPLKSQILLSVNMQLSDSSLVSAEKFSMGGGTTVRGYRENQITSDNGIMASAEWRVPVAQLKIPGLSKGTGDGVVQLCPFLDYGKGWNKNSADPDPDQIYSAGLAARWNISSNISAEICWGYALKDVPGSDEYDLQDDGIHFQITAGIF